MKVGDLVKLSAYGVARNYNSTVSHVEVGLIMGVNSGWQYPYQIQWTKAKPFTKAFHAHSRRELKYAER